MAIYIAYIIELYTGNCRAGKCFKHSASSFPVRFTVFSRLLQETSECGGGTLNHSKSNSSLPF